MRIPRHIAIIMDGNGRWAQRRHHPRVFGHVRGAGRIKEIVREADRLGVRALTLYAFSTENWSRPETELQVLWKLLVKFLRKEIDELERQGVCLRVIGELDRLDPSVRSVVESAIARLQGNSGLQLTVAVSYGSRKELIRAAQNFARDCVAGLAKPEDLHEETLGNYLWTAGLGSLADVDLVIRTSGEVRVSNFLLWQAAYAEFYFTELCWPDFRAEHLREAVASYSKRERRFGALTPAAELTV